MNTIAVVKRTNDYMACLNGDTRKWEAGDTSMLALAYLVISCAKELGIEITLPPIGGKP